MDQVKDYPLSQLRRVTLCLRDHPSQYSNPHMYYMHESQVTIFIEASVKLFQTEGNPHIKDRTGQAPPNNLWYIEVARLSLDTASYWWCTPDLQNNNAPKGAQINNYWNSERVWSHPELLKWEKAFYDTDKYLPHWSNPWEGEVVYVPIEELVLCAAGIGFSCLDTRNGQNFVMTEEDMLSHWKQYGEKLDAYILPCPSGLHCIGIRYGNKGHEYLSPAGDKKKVAALLRKYT